MQKTSIFAMSIFALALAGCGGRPDEKIDREMASNNHVEAIQWLEKELKDAPKDHLLNALLAEVIVNRCVKEAECASLPAADAASVTAILADVDTPIKVSVDIERKPYQNMLDAITAVDDDEKRFSLILSILSHLPANAPKALFANTLMAEANTNLLALNFPEAQKRLIGIVANMTDTDAEYHAAQVLLFIMRGDLEATTPHVQFLEEHMPQLADAFIAALPYSIYAGDIAKDPKNGALTFANTVSDRINASQRKGLESQSAQAVLAKTLITMAEDEAFVSAALSHISKEVQTPPSSEQNKQTQPAQAPAIKGLETPQAEEATLLENGNETLREMFYLRLLKQALVFNPDQPEIWTAFLQPAMDYVDSTGDTDLLFANMNQNKIPSDELGPYNKRLFDAAEQKLAMGENMLPLLEKVVIPNEKSAAVERRVNELSAQGLAKALENKKTDLLISYATFRPDVAKQSRQQIVNLVIKNIETLWLENDFSTMEARAEFLEKTMEIDFNFNNLLLQNFESYMTTNKLLEKLNSDTPDVLTQPQRAIALNLNPKFAYLAHHFAENRAMLDNQLKTFIAGAKGLYGTATALYRLYNLFGETTFPERDRQEYLTASIKKSLAAQTTLKAPEFARIGQQLHAQHPGISLLFVIGETLKRIETLDEARQVWNDMAPTFRANIRNIRPQFSTLMRAIELFEEGQRSKAAQLFNIISDEQYLLQAEPYLKSYTAMVEDHKGVFLSTETDENMHALMLIVSPALQTQTEPEPMPEPEEAPAMDAATATEDASPTEISESADKPKPAEEPIQFNSDNMLDVNVTLINAVGSVLVRSHMQLVEDYGQIFRTTLRGELNPDTMNVEIPEELRAVARLPQSFENTFGAITRLHFSADGAIKVFVEGHTKPYTFRKVSDNTTRPIFPKGRYGITEQVAGNDPNFAHVLPQGSIIELDVDKTQPMQPQQEGKVYSIVYPIEGQLWHPSTPEPRPIKGYFTANNNTVTFRYNYPYGADGNKLEAVAKCHLIDTQLICGAHNKHWNRRRFSHIVKGQKAEAGNMPNQDLLPPPAQ